MNSHFQSRNNELQSLVNAYEESLKNNEAKFFSEEELVQLIDFYEYKGAIKKALAVTERGNELFSFSSIFYIRKANIFTLLKKFDSAWEAIQKARAYDPLAKEISLLIVDYHVANNDFDNAVSELEELYYVADNDEKQDVLLELLDIYETFKKRDLMLNLLKTLVSKYPSNEEVVHRLWSFSKDFDACNESIELFQEIIDYNPTNFLAWYYLANCYKSFGLYEKAINAYEYTLAIEEYYFAYWDYTYCLRELKQYDKAIEVFEEMVEIFDEDPNVYIELGHCFLAKNQNSLAIDAFTKAIDLSTDLNQKTEIRYFIGKAYFNSNLVKRAQVEFKSCTEVRSKKIKYWNALGKTYEKQFLLEEASTCFVKSLALEEEQPKIWRRLAYSYYNLGYNDAVLETFKNAILVLPNNSKMYYHFAGYLFQFNKTQQALYILEQALSLNPKKRNSIFKLFPELQENNYILELYSSFEH